MSKTFLKAGLVFTIAFLCFSLKPASAEPTRKDICEGRQTNAYDRCISKCQDVDGNVSQSCMDGCWKKSMDVYNLCIFGSSKTPLMPPSTPPPVATPTSGLPTTGAGPTQPGSGTSPTKWGGSPLPGKVGTEPTSGGGGTPPPGLTGVHPVFPVNPNPVKVNEPGTGSPTGTTGTPPVQIYAIKPPEVTTSPIGITTTKVYDEKGNFTKTMTGPTGEFLEKITTTLDPNGGSKSVTTNAEGKILNTTVTKSDGTSILYNSAGKIVSQVKKITTTGTGGTYSKGHKESFLGDFSQKHKEKSMNEFFHENKVKQLDSVSAPSSQSHSRGGHR